MKFAPASTARLTVSTFNTVPAPTSIPGRLHMARMLASAAVVRKVTSAVGRPPGKQRVGERTRVGCVVDRDHRHQPVRTNHFKFIGHLPIPFLGPDISRAFSRLQPLQGHPTVDT